MTRIRWATSLLVVPLLLSSVSQALAVPSWSRRYGLSCTACHNYPSHQLTAMGLDFLRRGHRFDKDTFDADLGHMLAAHGEWDYTVQEHESTAFPSPEFHFHAGGALDKHFSAYADANLQGDFESLYVQFTKTTGKGDDYFTARLGKISPTIVRDYGNGLAASVSTPLILTDATLDENPFTPARDSFGVDVAQRWKALFIQGGVLNGDDVPGQATVNNKKDVYVSVEINADKQPTGIGLYYHRGRYDIGDATAGPLLPDTYEREGVFANYTRDKMRVGGAFLFGKDSIRTLPDRKIRGLYAQADAHPVSWAVPFLRYDWVRTEDENGIAKVHKITGGAAFLLFSSDVTAGHFTLELSRRTEGDTNTNAALVSVMWAF